MKSTDFTNAPLAVKSLYSQPDHVAELIDTEVAAARILNSPQLIKDAEKLRERFTYLLKYLVHNDIPNIEEDTDIIRNQAVELRRNLLMEYNIANNHRSYYASLRFQRLRPEENLASLASDYLSELSRRRDDPTSMMSNSSNSHLEEISSDIFERIRTAFNFSEHEGLLSNLLEDPEIPSADRVLWTAAIGMGQIEYYDPARTEFLLHLMNTGDPKVKVAAAVWLALAVVYADEDSIGAIDFPFDKIADSAEKELFGMAVFEMIRLIAVEHLSPEERNELIPSMETMMKNINMPRNAEQARELMKNPGGMASSPEMYDWIHRFNEAIREGYDVQAPTLGRLRHWNFFGKLSNWLLPYDANHSALAGIADEDGAPLADMLTKLGTLVDSDKYALILSLNNVPASMREAAIQGNMEQMGADSEEFNEALSEEERNASKLRNRVNNYAKQVWRVFTTHPQKAEFEPQESFDTLKDRLELNQLNFSDDYLRNLIRTLFKLKDGRSVGLLSDFIVEPTEADERLRARAAFLTKDSVLEDMLKVYLKGHPEDLDLAIEAVEKGFIFPEALNIFRENELTDSENIPFLKAYVKVLKNNLEYSDAIDQLMALEYLDQPNAAEYRMKRSELHLRLQQWKEAAEILSETSPTAPHDIAAKAFALWMTGKRTDALNLLEANKGNAQLNSAMLRQLRQYGESSGRNDRALLYYLIESWEYILNNSNPLNL